MAIFVTIYNHRAHNYFITIVMKFRIFRALVIMYKKRIGGFTVVLQYINHTTQNVDTND